MLCFGAGRLKILDYQRYLFIFINFSENLISISRLTNSVFTNRVSLIVIGIEIVYPKIDSLKNSKLFLGTRSVQYYNR